MHKKILVVDATWLIRRQFHATNKGIVKGQEDLPEGELPAQDPNIVIISFLQTLLKTIRELDYEYKTILTWDRGTYRYRPKEELTEYKATREYDPTFQCCWDATNITVELMRNLGFTSIQVGGVEADDLGCYYSHNSEECILYTVDRDWFLSITPTTKILRPPNEWISYDDIIKDHISSPRELAIEKAIQGDGSDNIGSISTNLNISEAIEAYKQRSLSTDILAAIDRNMRMTRVDHILADTEVHDMIKHQEKLVAGNVNTVKLMATLASLGNYPSYFLGVLGKYNRLHNTGV